ncbi:MAG: TonB-dependent receptor [Bacteroidota bacterium]
MVLLSNSFKSFTQTLRVAGLLSLLVGVAGALGAPPSFGQSGSPSQSDETARPEAMPADTVRMASVVVTATRTAKEIEDVAVPVSVVSAEEIERQGAVRLGDVLAAVPGLHFFDDHGTGLQVQGFSPEYTLILIDGQPVIGRTAGTLDLDRITVQGVERVELVRGPSSSLYGSEALAGVVNIITAQPSSGWSGGLSTRAGSFTTTDVSADVNAGFDRGGVRLLVNRYASEGYDLAPESFGNTAPAFQDWTADLRTRFDVNDQLRLRLGVRATTLNQDGAFAIVDDGGTPDDLSDDIETRYDDVGKRVDWSVHPEAEWRFSERFRLRTTLFASRYQTKTRIRSQTDGSLLFGDDFDQRLTRAETQLDAFWGLRHLTVFGAGLSDERLGGSRYTFNGEQPVARQAFAFAQHEWTPSRLLALNASARFDAHSDYAAQLSPKLSVLVRPIEALRLRASVGTGFKAPAFRQLYLTFTNTAAGYSVLGSARLRDGLLQFVEDGIVAAESIPNLDGIEEIQAETSVAYNAGATVAPWSWLSTSVNLFYNDVENLIDTQIVAQKVDGSPIFGYYNVDEVYTRGLETEMTVRPLVPFGFDDTHHVEVAVGYQFLQARDPAVVESLERGETFERLTFPEDESGITRVLDRRIDASDYAGLLGRSPHSATLRATYRHDPFDLDVSVRARHRSRYGYIDLDGNGVATLDNEVVNGVTTLGSEFIAGHTIVDATLTKGFTVGSTLTTLQVGIDNLTNVTRGAFVPSLPGRRLYAVLRLSL